MVEEFVYPEGDLSEAMELYCQHRASGKTKTNAARLAYPQSKYPNKHSHLLEKDPRVLARINELKLERAEVYGLDQTEQIRKYHEIYNIAMENKQLATAMKALERIDAIGGFEVKRSESVRVTREDALGSKDGDLKKDLEKFKGILGLGEESSEGFVN